MDSTDTTSGNADTTKKEVKTTAIVNNGESVILGGLIEDKEENTESKIPLLGDIPLLGNLFKHDSTAVRKRRLVIIITPYIIPKSKDLTFVRNELSQLKLLEDKFLKRSLIRLKENQIKQIQEDNEFNNKIEILDGKLNTVKNKIKTEPSVLSDHEKRVAEILGN